MISAEWGPPRPRRVVFVAWQIPEPGGCGTATEALGAAMVRRGLLVEFISVIPGIRQSDIPTLDVFRLPNVHGRPVFRQAGDLRTRLAGLGLLVRKVHDRRRGLRSLKRRLGDFGPETVIIFTNVGPKQLLDAAGHAFDPQGAVIIGQHHSSFAGAVATQQLEQLPRHFSDADAFVALTVEDAAEFSRILKAPCVGVPNIAPRLPHEDRRAKPIAVALSRYSSEKRLDVMVRAFQRATDSPELHEWELHIYGSGPLRDPLQALVDGLGLGHRVKLNGRIENVTGALSTASVHLMTSEFEGLPMSVLESSAMGIPTVAFDCSAGMRELVSDETGSLVRHNDFEGYVLALREMLSDEPLRTTKGAAALASVSRFSEDAVVARWRDVFDQCYRRRGLTAKP